MRSAETRYNNRLNKAITSIKNGSVAERRQAVMSLRDIGTPETVPPLIWALNDTEHSVRSTVALALGVLHSEEATEHLISSMLHDSSPHVRVCCAVSLTWVQNATTTKAFVQALDDTEPKVVLAAIGALDKADYPLIIPLLSSLVTHPDWKIRFYSCEVIFRRGHVTLELISAIAQLANEPEAAQHDAAAEDADQIFGKDLQSPVHCRVNDLLVAAQKTISTN